MNDRKGDDYKHITKPGFNKALWTAVKASFFSEYAIFDQNTYKSKACNLLICKATLLTKININDSYTVSMLWVYGLINYLWFYIAVTDV